jgi:hypothetical protein
MLWIWVRVGPRAGLDGAKKKILLILKEQPRHPLSGGWVRPRTHQDDEEEREMECPFRAAHPV